MQVSVQPAGVTSVPMFPAWVPESARMYVSHKAGGVPFRVLARASGWHASTILRTIRRQEIRRDDPLVDEAFSVVERTWQSEPRVGHGLQEPPSMLSEKSIECSKDDPRIVSEAKRILRRLCESGAFLAVSPDAGQGVVFRPGPTGELTRIAVVDRDVVYAFALKDWIEGRRLGSVGRYTITAAGRGALKRILTSEAEARSRKDGYAERPGAFRGQHQLPGEKWIMSLDGSEPARIRADLAESPLSALARKRHSDGTAFLTLAMLQAGEKLREDFEQAQLGPRVTQNWENFLTASVRQGYRPSAVGDQPSAARERVADAMAALGPGLADIAFRCCCFLEGVATAEKRLNWSARSGKVVLRIALGRLAEHYGYGRLHELPLAA